MADRKVDLLNPVGEVDVKEVQLAARPKRLEGLTLGILDNSKHNADYFLRRAGEELKKKFGLQGPVMYRKTNASVPVHPEAEKALSECGLLLTAFGD